MANTTAGNHITALSGNNFEHTSESLSSNHINDNQRD